MSFAFPDYCVCPESGAPLIQTEKGLLCSEHQALYEIRNGIPVLLPAYDQKERKRYLKSYQMLARDDLESPLEADRSTRHQVLLEFIGNTKGKKVLDIGSSNALYLRQLEADLKVAFDLAYPFLSTIPPTSGVIRICGDAEFLPFKPGFFDVIVIADILEHLLNPDRLVQRLNAICQPDTRIIVHVPWEEDLISYRDSKYEFTHLRSFNSYTFAELWKDDYYIRRCRNTYPSLEQPFVFRLERRVPRFIYNMLVLSYYRNHVHLALLERWRDSWVREIPKRERWLLSYYAPKFRMFELRLVKHSGYDRPLALLDWVSSRIRSLRNTILRK